ncbi:hypothetical protein [Oceanibium sediminis]|uniref:hypothetical protein n=1 Tax=Oceanibium sediminis TaxID=2026339 RepID=UPI000DD40C8E|nr:hypothetical protein [Oceanibium sediminis]
MIIAILRGTGRNARWVLSGGCILALFLPGISASLRPALPVLVSMVFALAMARIDLAGTLRAAIQPRRLAFLLVLSFLLLPLTALLYGTLGRLFGPEVSLTLVYLAAAPPIASAAGLCFLLGFNARLALEITVAASLLTPILGPLAVALAAPETAPRPDPLILARNLSLMIFGGVLAATLIRRAIGPGRIADNAQIFDGIAALGMLVFVFPLFDKVGALILADPARAAGILALAVTFNVGVNLATRATLGNRLPAEDTGAYGITFGNRTIAMYLAVVPFEPVFALFVALYQIPMYFTPLVLARLSLVPAPKS